MNAKAWTGLVIIVLTLALAGIIPKEPFYMTTLLISALIGSFLFGYNLKAL